MTEKPDKQKRSRIAVAPMMDWTDRHCRYFMRLLSPSAFLYTEMVTAAAIYHGDADRFLKFNNEEHPLALQLGGSEPGWMASATAKASDYGYDEININVGCPSDKVQSGQFGACLMARPDTVAACYRTMLQETDIPITVKTRIGIDDKDSYEFLQKFVESMLAVGCRKFVVHARIAILDGLSPKENRTIPPLNYERVYRLKRDHPELEIVINGGLADIQQVDEVLEFVDGAMIGRWSITSIRQYACPTGEKSSRKCCRTWSRRYRMASPWVESPGTCWVFTQVNPAPERGVAISVNMDIAWARVAKSWLVRLLLCHRRMANELTGRVDSGWKHAHRHPRDKMPRL